jgi:hypothetical protein
MLHYFFLKPYLPTLLHVQACTSFPLITRCKWLLLSGDRQQQHDAAPVASHTSSEGTILSHGGTEAQRFFGRYKMEVYILLHLPVCSRLYGGFVQQEERAAVCGLWFVVCGVLMPKWTP